MEKGNLAKWRKKEGDTVKSGDVIADVETDKATVEWEATEDGVVGKLLVAEGTHDIKLGTPVLVIVDKKEDVAAFANYKSDAAPAAAPKTEAPKAAEAAAPAPPPPTPQVQTQAAPQAAAPQAASSQSAAQLAQDVVPGAPPGSVFPPKSGVSASPLAKALAAQSGVPLSRVAGTGPQGRIIGADVVNAAQSFAASAPSAAAYIDIPNTQIRKITAQRLAMSKQTIPHYYLTIDCRLDEALKLRQQLNERANNEYKLSLNDFVIKASALACRKVPAANSSWSDDAIRRFNNVDINVAVNTEKGLFTPIVKDADKIGLAAIANTVKDLADRARANKLKPEEFTGGTFTISNLGMFGIKEFAAVINPPQACILAVGRGEKRVVVNEKDQLVPANMMTVTLSCDHRIVDGAIGAEWLKYFKEYMEEPMKMLL